MNPSYKHLDSKLRIAELSIGQWLAVGLGVGIAVGWGFYVTPPIGPTLTAITAIYLGSLPAGAALLASWSEFDLWLTVRSALRWRRTDGLYVPGPGDSARGYLLNNDETDERRGRRRQPAAALDLESLWEE